MCIGVGVRCKLGVTACSHASVLSFGLDLPHRPNHARQDSHNPALLTLVGQHSHSQPLPPSSIPITELQCVIDACTLLACVCSVDQEAHDCGWD